MWLHSTRGTGRQRPSYRVGEPTCRRERSQNAAGGMSSPSNSRRAGVPPAGRSFGAVLAFVRVVLAF